MHIIRATRAAAAAAAVSALALLVIATGAPALPAGSCQLVTRSGPTKFIHCAKRPEGTAPPFIESLKPSLTGKTRMVVLVHSTARLQLEIWQQSATQQQAGKMVTPVTPVSTLALGLQQRGTRILRFNLRAAGKPLTSGSYAIEVQALKPNGSLKSESAVVLVTVAGAQITLAAA